MDPLSKLAIDSLNAARRWVQARIILRRALDSKTATPQHVEQAKQGYNRTAEELEALVMRLERMILLSGKRVPKGRQAAGSPFPWRELFGMVAAGAKAVENALGTPPGTVTVQAKKIDKTIIDAEIE